MATKAERAAEAAEAVARLRAEVAPGSTIFGIVRQVARSGMSRRIDFYVIEDGRPRYLTGLFARALGRRLGRGDRGLLVAGCGMDMVFATVYDAAATVHGQGYAWKAETL